MKITLTDAGKRFSRDWIFRHISYEFYAGRSYSITGPNGSGKSTLLQVIAGAIHPSEGTVSYEMSAGGVSQGSKTGRPGINGHLTSEKIYQHLSISAPYLDLVEEMTLSEFLSFHHVFKPFLSSLSVRDMISLVDLESATNKQIRYFSSGMKQRVKLAQAIFSDTAILLLDEPCTNLDEAGIAVYQKLVADYSQDRLIIVSSNDVQEYAFCQETLNLKDFK
jgi:ABC-type multidrug transport system ATPase subunit